MAPIFSVVDNIDDFVSKLNKDLMRIQNQAQIWKMHCNPHKAKPTQEVLFSGKTKNTTCPNLSFKNSLIPKSTQD